MKICRQISEKARKTTGKGSWNLIRSYFRASPEKLREIYAKYIPYLTIQKESDISESPEFQRIKEENQMLVTEIIRHTIERKELQDLHEQLEMKGLTRNEYERNVGSLIETTVAEQMSEFRRLMDDNYQ